KMVLRDLPQRRIRLADNGKDPGKRKIGDIGPAKARRYGDASQAAGRKCLYFLPGQDAFAITLCGAGGIVLCQCLCGLNRLLIIADSDRPARTKGLAMSCCCIRLMVTHSLS